MSKDYKDSMSKTLLSFLENVKSVRVGRVTSDYLNSVMVDAYGAKMSINQVGSVSVIDATKLSVTVFDAGLVKEVLTGIIESGLSSNTSSSGNVVLLSLPPITEERRKDMAKALKNQAEEYKVRIRNIRKDAMNIIKEELRLKQISEDEAKRQENEVQKETDSMIAKIQEAFEKKEKEILG